MIRLFEEIIALKSPEKDDDEMVIEAKQAYEYLLMDEKFKTRNGYPIRFTQRGFKEFFYSVDQVMKYDKKARGAASNQVGRNAHEIGKLLATVSRLGDAVAQMTPEYYSKNKKPDKKPMVDGYQHCSCPILIDGKHRKLHLTFEILKTDKSRGGSYYYHFLESKQTSVHSLILTSCSIS